MLDLPAHDSVWPENVYPGLTVCNQKEADKKIPVFLQVPGKKFLSIEPMLGPVDLSGIAMKCAESGTDCGGGIQEKRPGCWKGNCMGNAHVDAVILGGETGPGARPMHPDWVRSVRNQCQVAGVPFFFKQWGTFGRSKKCGRLLDGRTHDELPWVG
ncbi:MAG: DUF5131 family protein [Candidatus Omnitrophota bacterium]